MQEIQIKYNLTIFKLVWLSILQNMWQLPGCMAIFEWITWLNGADLILV